MKNSGCEVTRAALVELFKTGIGFHQAARILRCNWRFGAKVFQELAANYEWTHARREMLAALWMKDTPMKQIAAALECSPIVVMRKVAELDLPPRRRRSSDKRYLPSASSDVQTTPRPCMCCGQKFGSEGKHNRLCGNCRRRENPEYMFAGHHTRYGSHA